MSGGRGEIAGAVYVKLWPLNANEAFSLTLTLSRWEREQPLDKFVKFERSQAAVRAQFDKTRGTFLPLRVGGVGGADGERAGVKCLFNQSRVLVIERLVKNFTLVSSYGTAVVLAASRIFALGFHSD